jgi:hypothetical protein
LFEEKATVMENVWGARVEAWKPSVKKADN